MYTLDEEKLRHDLQDYYGTAAYSGFPMAAMDAMRVNSMSTQELVNKAQRNGFNMSRYVNDDDDVGEDPITWRLNRMNRR